MPKFIFHVAVNTRSYGDVEAAADTIEEAAKLLTADYISENIAPHETTWDGLTAMSLLDTHDEDGNDLDFALDDLPSEYDCPPKDSAVITAGELASIMEEHNDKIERRLIHPMLAALKTCRDLIDSALYTHIYEEGIGCQPGDDDPYVLAIAQADAIIARAEGEGGAPPAGIPDGEPFAAVAAALARPSDPSFIAVVDGDRNADIYGYADTEELAMLIASETFADPVVRIERYGPISLSNGAALTEAFVAITDGVN